MFIEISVLCMLIHICIYVAKFCYLLLLAIYYGVYYRRDGFVYQYFNTEQDVEGSLEIVTTQIGGIESRSVINGSCPDFFEFRMVNRIIAC